MKTVISFLIALIVGATLALVVRSVLHDAHADHTEPRTSPAVPAPAAPATSTPEHQHPPAPDTPEDPHAGHAPAAAAEPDPASGPVPASAPQTVNSICPICGMDVDPTLGIWHYQGKPIGIGCRACVDKIEQEIDRYGPAALDNKRLR